LPDGHSENLKFAAMWYLSKKSIRKCHADSIIIYELYVIQSSAPLFNTEVKVWIKYSISALCESTK